MNLLTNRIIPFLNEEEVRRRKRLDLTHTTGIAFVLELFQRERSATYR